MAPPRTAAVRGPSCQTVSSASSRKRPTRPVAERSSWQATGMSGGAAAVVRDGLVGFEQEAADEVCRGEVFVAGDGDERAAQAPRHVLDEARLAAARRAFEHDGQARIL